MYLLMCRGSEDRKRLDLNNLPVEYGERQPEGKEIMEESSTTSTETTDASSIYIYGILVL